MKEQNVPLELEQDDRDQWCQYVLLEVAKQPVGTGRLDIQKSGKIGRLAILPEHRFCGLGTRLLQELEALATAAALPEVWLNAQIPVISFYKRLGYSVCSEEFEEAGMRHVKMTKRMPAEF